MSKQNVKALIDANIKQNSRQEITGNVLNGVLNAMLTDYAEQDATMQEINQLKAVNNALPARTLGHAYNDKDTEVKSNSFRSLLDTTGDYETFLFFSDPHPFWNGSEMTDQLATEIRNKFTEIEKFYKTNAFNFILDGGDWLNARDTKDQATDKLAFLKGLMTAVFGDDHKFMVGNHDTNYQGVARLSQDELNSILYGGGKSYYTFKTAKSRVYIFDTGDDWTNTMDTYKWEQIAWFAENLRRNGDKYILTAGHIYRNAWGDGVASVFVQNIMKVISAFNERTSVTLNGVTYDFASVGGRIYVYFAGHKHTDYELVDPIGGIQVIGIAKQSTLSDLTYPVTFDMVKVNYTNNVVNCVRVGNGEDRTIDLRPVSWETIAPSAEIPGWRLIGEYRCNASSNDKLVKYAVNPGDLLRIHLEKDSTGYIACQFQKTSSVSSSDASGQGGKEMYIQASWNDGIYAVPEECYYLIVSANVNNNTNTVEKAVSAPPLVPTATPVNVIGDEHTPLNLYGSETTLNGAKVLVSSEQTLTDGEKSQVRINIGAVSMTEVETAINNAVIATINANY